MGWIFFRSGLGNIDGFGLNETAFVLFENEFKLPFIAPVPAAYMATAGELFLPPLLWLGLFTRFAATGLLIMTLIIEIFVYPAAYETHGLWSIGLLLIMTFGPGRLSLDHLLGWEKAPVRS
jgi:putative oxidoreductase